MTMNSSLFARVACTPGSVDYSTLRTCKKREREESSLCETVAHLLGPNAVTQVLTPVQTVPISNDMSNVILPPWAPSLEFIVRNCACHYCNKTPNQSIILRSCKYILLY
jgi:hypothetical protein